LHCSFQSTGETRLAISPERYTRIDNSSDWAQVERKRKRRDIDNAIQESIIPLKPGSSNEGLPVPRHALGPRASALTATRSRAKGARTVAERPAGARAVHASSAGECDYGAAGSKHARSKRKRSKRSTASAGQQRPSGSGASMARAARPPIAASSAVERRAEQRALDRSRR
jgi:hypothetical protein